MVGLWVELPDWAHAGMRMSKMEVVVVIGQSCRGMLYMEYTTTTKRTVNRVHLVRTISALCVGFSLAALLVGSLREALGASVCDQPTKMERTQADSVLRPFWMSFHVDREPVLFVRTSDAKAITARLLFSPTHIISVRSGNGCITYDEGRDYRWKQESNILTLTPNSRIPFRTWAQLHPAIGAAQSYGDAIGGKSSLLFVEGGAFFQRLQVTVTYDHKEQWAGVVPRPGATHLKRSIAILRAHKSLKLVVLGDSISEGYCASGFFGGKPYQPPYPILVKEALQIKYGARVVLKNFSVAGMTSKWGVSMAPAVARETPDLVIIAFGMNDASARVSSKTYIQNISSIMAAVRQKNPEADFILVATMTANPEWTKTNPALYAEYRYCLSQLVGSGVALADITSLWWNMLQLKTFVDLTGNGINHPNDFGHMVYAQVILCLFREPLHS